MGKFKELLRKIDRVLIFILLLSFLIGLSLPTYLEAHENVAEQINPTPISSSAVKDESASSVNNGARERSNLEMLTTHIGLSNELSTSQENITPVVSNVSGDQTTTTTTTSDVNTSGQSVFRHKTVPIKANFSTREATRPRSKNYASVECAKVVEANPEAKKTSHIINDMNDEYMLNPCKAKIWFVIELCESIAAKQIEIANYELFSSMPKDFAVYFSDTYPASDWKPVGEFTATDSKTLQAFELSDVGFGKFIRVELHSHYGNEHYCPISEVKVYGESMVEEYEKKKDPTMSLLSGSKAALVLRKLKRKTSALKVYRNMMLKSTACGLQPSTEDEVEDDDENTMDSTGLSVHGTSSTGLASTFAGKTGSGAGGSNNDGGTNGSGGGGSPGSNGGGSGTTGAKHSDQKKKKKQILPQPTPAPSLRASVFVELSNQVKALETSLKTQIDDMQRRLKDARSGKHMLELEFSKLQLQFRSFALIVISYFVYEWMLVLM